MNYEAVRTRIRQPASAAVAGIVFAIIFGIALVLLQGVSATVATEGGRWADDPDRRSTVSLALGLLPFAGIALLWFIAVIRANLGSSRDRFFETVFLGSGLLFVAMLFAAAASVQAVLDVQSAGIEMDAGQMAFGWALATQLVGEFGARMAAVFTLSATTVGRRAGTLPRWLAVAGALIGVLLLLTPPLPNWAQLLFPAWVLALSIFVLVRAPAAGGGDAP